MADPEVGSEWEIRYRVKGRSAVWPDMFVCDIISGPDKGQYVIFEESRFSGKPTPEGKYRGALALARKGK